jgi:hypothetical protein
MLEAGSHLIRRMVKGIFCRAFGWAWTDGSRWLEKVEEKREWMVFYQDGLKKVEDKKRMKGFFSCGIGPLLSRVPGSVSFALIMSF